jgi:hypothetical protein
MPDGTVIASAYPSNLFAVYNAAYPQATWQREIARALQVWANVSNLNFHFVADDGSPQGTAGLAQGDSRFGDIRIGGYSMGSGILGIGWNPNPTTTGGDVELNTASALPIGSIPDLASVVMHEVGHGIGFNHSLADPAVMEGGLWGTYPGPYADDIAGVQAMYGARKPDAYDAAASNDSLATATPLVLSYGGVNLSADITTMADVDYYKVTAPSGTDGTLTVSVDARNLSLFDPKVTVFTSSGTQLATASASTYGDVATVNLSGLVAGQTYYLEASGATSDVFGMGAYKLTAQFGGFPPPPTIGPDKFEPNNTVATATNLGKVSSVSQTGLTLDTSGDVDYYTFTAASKGTVTVSVTPTQGSGTLSLTVLNAQQTVLASGQSQTGGVTLTVSLASGQQYYVKVSSPTGSLFVYSLSIGQASGGAATGGKHHLVAMGVENPDENPAGDVFYQNAADDPENHAPVPPGPGVGAAPPVTAAAEALPAAGAVPGRAGHAPGLAGALSELGPQAPPVLLAAAPLPAVVPAGQTTGSPSVLVPGPRLPAPRLESGGATRADDEEPDVAPAETPAPGGGPAAVPPDPEAGAPVDDWVWPGLCAACFVPESWGVGPAEPGVPVPGVTPEDPGPGPAPATAAVVLTFLWAGSGDMRRAEPEPDGRRRARA